MKKRLILWSIAKGDKINLNGVEYKVTGTTPGSYCVFVDLQEVAAKKPKGVFKRAFPKAEGRHL